MEDTTKLNVASFIFSFFLLFLLTGASHHHHHHGHHHHHHRSLTGSRPTKLFVFGDSYVDTGNSDLSGPCWNIPYGVTFPGKPAGRFSNGRVLTDYVAKFVGLKTPIAYRLWKGEGDESLENGMSFAYGGSGVVKTVSTYPNMTTQIGFLKKLINDSVFNQTDIQSSVALVNSAGNDYVSYFQLNGVPGFIRFIGTVMDQLKTNLKEISDLGVKKVAVGGLPPLGCLPPFTASTSNQQCIDILNLPVLYHNSLLERAVATLNNETDTTFFILDVYTSFNDILNPTSAGETKFVNPLKECCTGTNATHACGVVDAHGVKNYTLCENPESSFFWDYFHPTQAGWAAVYATLQTVLQQLLD